MFKFTYMPRSIEASDSHKLSYFALLTLIKVGVLAKSGQESMNFLRSRSRYSKTRYIRFSLWITSCSLHAAIKASQHASIANHLSMSAMALLHWIRETIVLIDKPILNDTHPLLQKSKATSSHCPLDQPTDRSITDSSVDQS